MLLSPGPRRINSDSLLLRPHASGVDVDAISMSAACRLPTSLCPAAAAGSEMPTVATIVLRWWSLPRQVRDNPWLLQQNGAGRGSIYVARDS